jgi:sodium/potassium-transporting ATPase subunit alpha
MIQVADMQVDNSALTGESELLLRSAECTSEDNPLETKNLAFFTTNCGNGQGRGIVINIGDNTIIGQIANLAASSDAGISPLRHEMDTFIILIIKIGFTVAAIFVITGFILGFPYLTNIMFAIGILVANAPEGLLTTITVGLALSA